MGTSFHNKTTAVSLTHYTHAASDALYCLLFPYIPPRIKPTQSELLRLAYRHTHMHTQRNKQYYAQKWWLFKWQLTTAAHRVTNGVLVWKNLTTIVSAPKIIRSWGFFVCFLTKKKVYFWIYKNSMAKSLNVCENKGYCSLDSSNFNCNPN